MDLILWRHADAEPGFPDQARQLTPKGQKQALRMAQWLKPQLSPDTVLIASGAVRAQQTLAALDVHFCIDALLNPGASPRDYLKRASAEATLIVGHQPEIGRVANLLLTEEDRELAVKKGSIWWFCQKDGGWQLRVMMTPDQLS